MFVATRREVLYTYTKRFRSRPGTGSARAQPNGSMSCRFKGQVQPVRGRARPKCLRSPITQRHLNVGGTRPHPRTADAIDLIVVNSLRLAAAAAAAAPAGA